MKSTPPTFFPKDVPANADTGMAAAYWIYRGDQAGTRFFIPHRGTRLPVKQLVGEARAAMLTASAPAAEKPKSEPAEAAAAGQSRTQKVLSSLKFWN